MGRGARKATFCSDHVTRKKKYKNRTSPLHFAQGASGGRHVGRGSGQQLRGASPAPRPVHERAFSGRASEARFRGAVLQHDSETIRGTVWIPGEENHLRPAPGTPSPHPLPRAGEETCACRAQRPPRAVAVGAATAVTGQLDSRQLGQTRVWHKAPRCHHRAPNPTMGPGAPGSSGRS